MRGKVWVFSDAQRDQRDHPRVCGEKGIVSILGYKIGGSPPRVRGKVREPYRGRGQPWITPACAGKRWKGAAAKFEVKDHPRVCGEKLPPFRRLSQRLGSPPRVRGKDPDRFKPVPKEGITPACAGKRLKKAHKIKDFDPVPIRFHLVFRRFERWCSNLPTPDGNVPV